MRLREKHKRKEFGVYAVYWTDATKEDDEPNGGLRPEPGVTVMIAVEIGDDYITGAGEVFLDGTKRNLTSIPAGMVEKIVRIGSAPNLETVFGKQK